MLVKDLRLQITFLKKRELEVPPVLERFQLLDKVGQGSYGQVFRAREKATGKIFALKEIFQQKRTSQGLTILEVRHLRQVQDHPNIVQLIDILFINRESHD